MIEQVDHEEEMRMLIAESTVLSDQSQRAFWHLIERGNILEFRVARQRTEMAMLRTIAILNSFVVIAIILLGWR
jgi:hypothetical protein